VPSHEVLERGETALVLACSHDRLDHVVTDVADGRETEPDVGADRGEVGRALVDVRRQDLDSHATTFVEIES